MKLDATKEDEEFITSQKELYEKYSNELADKMEEAANFMDDVEIRDHIAVLGEYKITAIKGEFTPYAHDDLPVERNYVSELVERYLKDMLNRRNYEINPHKEI